MLFFTLLGRRTRHASTLSGFRSFQAFVPLLLETLLQTVDVSPIVDRVRRGIQLHPLDVRHGFMRAAQHLLEYPDLTRRENGDRGARLSRTRGPAGPVYVALDVLWNVVRHDQPHIRDVQTPGQRVRTDQPAKR